MPILSSGRPHAVPFNTVPNDKLLSQSVQPTTLLESLEQFTKTAAQKTSHASCGALSTQVTEQTTQTRLRAAVGLVSACSNALQHLGDFCRGFGSPQSRAIPKALSSMAFCWPF
jgi:hypothetical protein